VKILEVFIRNIEGKEKYYMSIIEKDTKINFAGLTNYNKSIKEYNSKILKY
jgi:hypothetical protein